MIQALATYSMSLQSQRRFIQESNGIDVNLLVGSITRQTWNALENMAKYFN
jgi:hypothetical protein